jgi:inosine-uridine nucleoside N-ribohydrolase
MLDSFPRSLTLRRAERRIGIDAGGLFRASPGIATGMPSVRKLIIDLDPGVGDALAATLALLDPDLDVLALTATAGVVSGSTATRNLHAVVAEVDPPKWPRIGAAPPNAPWAERGRTAPGSMLDALRGPTGLGDMEVVVPELHHRHESSKVLIDIVRDHPHEVTLLTLGPLGNVVAACERAPDFLGLLAGFVCLGGSVDAGGDITAAAETNIFLNPEAARLILSAPEAKTLVPLDVTNRVILTYELFQRVTDAPHEGAAFLRRLLPFSFRAHHQFLGMEGIPIREATALAAVARPHLFRTIPLPVDVETQGELTRGMTVFERRPQHVTKASTTVAVEVDAQGILDYVTAILR